MLVNGTDEVCSNKSMMNIFDLLETDLCRLAETTKIESVLSELSNSIFIRVQRLVAKNSCTPGEALDRLSRVPDMFVREYVVSNTNAWASTVNRLALDIHENVQEAAIDNVLVREDIRQELCIRFGC